MSYQAAIGILIGLATLLVTIVGVILQYAVGVLRRRIIYGVTGSVRMVNPSVKPPELHILWRDKEVSDPHLLEIDLIYRGRVDIRSPAFDKGRPFCIDVGVPIVDVIGTLFHPGQEPLPKVAAEGTKLKVGPDLWRKRQTMTLAVLTDGPGGRLTCENPLADVKAKRARYQAGQESSEALHWRQSGMLKKVVTWAVVIFVVYYLATQPTWLHAAGTSLARFVNSL